MFSTCIITSHVIKHICKICDENVSQKKRKKRKTRKIKKLFQIKEFSQIVLGKMLLVYFILSNIDSNQFEFSYLAKLLSTFKVKPSLDAFHSQLSDEQVPGQS